MKKRGAYMESRSLSNLIEPNPEFGIEILNRRNILPPTAEDLQPEEVGKVSKEYRQEFSRLKRLALAIGVQKVVVTPSHPGEDDGHYFYSGWELDSLVKQDWDLTKEEITSLNKKEGGVILVFYQADPFCRHFAHEIGHHLYRLAQFTKKEQSMSVTKTMKGFFPRDDYLYQIRDEVRDEIRDEICAECFAEYLTVPAFRRGVERHCDSILRRVRAHNPNAAELTESYRRTVLL